MSTTFADLKRGDVFRFANTMAGDESYEKTGDHEARRVNSPETRYVSGDARVYVLYAAADRAARLRAETHYQDATGWHRKHDVYGGPHDEPPAQDRRCDKALDTASEVCPRCFRQHAWLLETRESER